MDIYDLIHCVKNYIYVTFSAFFYLGWITVLNFAFVKIQNQCTQLNFVAHRYKKHFIVINKIMKHFNHTGHSQYVQRLIWYSHWCVGWVYSFWSLGKTSAGCKNFCTFESFSFPHIWLFKLYLMPGKLNLKIILKGFEVNRFNWSLALCSDSAGSAGLTNRASLPASRIFSNERTVLIEFSSTVSVVYQAVSADAVPHRIVAIQGTKATALQWLLIAVTAINNNREGWPGSVVQCINKEATHRVLRGCLRHTSAHRYNKKLHT